MNKRDAKNLACSGDVTFGHLKRLVEESSKDDAEPSAVNRQVTVGFMRDLFKEILMDRDGDRTPIDSHGRAQDGDIMRATNVLREFAPAGWAP